MRKILAFLLIGTAVAGVSLAATTSLRELVLDYRGAVVAEAGDIAVLDSDVIAFLNRTSAEERDGVLDNLNRVEAILQDLVLTQALAHEAVANGALDESEHQAVIYQFAMGYLADLHTTQVLDERMLQDYSEQAKEIYLRNPDEFQSPERYSFTHILLSREGRKDSESVQMLKQVRARILEGESMGAIAREMSDDPSAQRNAGKFEAIEPEDLESRFATRLKELLESGQEISNPVRSAYGWHLIRIDDHEPARRLDYDEVSDRLLKRARQEHRQEIRNRYFSALISDEMKIYDSALKDLRARLR